MGEEIDRTTFSEDDHREFRSRLDGGRAVLAELLADERRWSKGTGPGRTVGTVGMEIELALVDGTGAPAMVGEEAAEGIDAQGELGRFNLELNVPPFEPADRAEPGLEARLEDLLADTERAVASFGARTVLIGILPTLDPEALGPDGLSRATRYQALDRQVLARRGAPLRLSFDGPEPLEGRSWTVAPEAACTSTQLHVRVTPERYAAAWNAAARVAGVQLAMGANSPLLLGHRLWQETRIPLFTQAVDDRPPEDATGGRPPRVWFGDRWIDSVLEQIDENRDRFAVLLPVCAEDGAEATNEREEDRTPPPTLAELRMHNGTVYRWNRPVYDVADGVPHLRVENRVLPSGPTIVDTLANAAFFFGLVEELAGDAGDDGKGGTAFPAAAENFLSGARDGISARLSWPGLGRLRARDLVGEHLLPLAAAGLERLGLDRTEVSRLLGIVAGRCEHGVNGASWQTATLQAIHDGPGRPTRTVALKALVERYVALMGTNQPVHTWPVG